jgi:iron complex transport system substrate-binding protein
MIRALALSACVCLASAAGGPSPSRIVSTSPSVTEVLFALGLADRVVGVSSYCRYPAAAAALPKVGTFLRPNAELIARLQPDLAVVSRSATDVPRQLSVLGVRSITVNESRTITDVYATIRDVGRAAGVEARADTLVAEMQTRLDGIRRGATSRRRVLVVVGRSPGTLADLVVVGRASFLSEVVEISGGINALGDATKLPAYPHISMETVIRLQPDVIVDAGDMGDTPDEHVRRQPITEALWRRETMLAAARHGDVHAVTSDAFVVPGPRIVEAAETLSRWIREAAR